MPHRFHLNADLREVWKRLAEKHSRVSSDGRAVDSYPTDSDSISLPGSTFKERE
jgi:hypothetical protein